MGSVTAVPTALEDLRAIVDYFDSQSEDFSDAFTLGELVEIWRWAMAHPEWPEFADTWTDEQLAMAVPRLAERRALHHRNRHPRG